MKTGITNAPMHNVKWKRVVSTALRRRRAFVMIARRIAGARTSTLSDVVK